MSVHSDEPLVRTQKQQTTQQVTTVTKVVREVQQLDDQSGEYIPVPLGTYAHPTQYVDYIEQPTHNNLYTQYHPHDHYQEYDHYPNPYGAYMSYPVGTERPSTPSPSEHSGDPSPLSLTSQPNAQYLVSGYDELPEHYRVTPSPGGPIGIDTYRDEPQIVYGYVSPSPYGTAPRPFVENLNGPISVNPNMRIYPDDNLPKHLGKMSIHGGNVVLPHERVPNISSPGSIGGEDDQRGMRWRDPNLTEVIGFLNNPNNVIKANAAAYLQHLCYMDDPNKQKTRALGGIPPLVKLLSHENVEVYKNACGALRNLSYGRQNDENKRAIKNAGGISALINLLRSSNEAEIRELVTGVIWNMSSCEDLKRNIIDDGLTTIVTYVIIPHSGWSPQGNHGETCWSTVFRNASGVLRNVSSAGEYARKKLRECEGTVDSLLYVVRSAIDKSNIGNKIVENCVCILRNLSYRCQEVEDPNYDRNPLPTQSRVQANTSSKGREFVYQCFHNNCNLNYRELMVLILIF